MNPSQDTRTPGESPAAAQPAWAPRAGLTPAQLEAARRVMRAHAERLSARPRADDAIGKPIEH
jgi:hypothetical protein